jgi:UDP-3-O-[3-hydroxymyristoyl] glucosamine N-acyltransferase
MKLSQVAGALGAEVIGDPDLEVRRLVHPLDAEGAGDLALAMSKAVVAGGGGERAGALVIGKDAAPPSDGRSAVRFPGPERTALSILTALFDPGPIHAAGIHPTATVGPGAFVGTGVSLGANVVVGARATIGERSVVLANVVIGADAVIGADCLIHPLVMIGDRVRIGDRVIIHSNTTVGADGFSFIPASQPGMAGTPGTMPVRIHSLGTVVIGDDVEIGAGTTIDRATLRATRIGRGTKIDNQVQIGHNAVIGEACLICGEAGIGGSAEVGDRTVIGGAAGVADHVKVGSDVAIGAMSGVSHSVPDQTVMLGAPAMPAAVFKERYLQIGRLKSLREQVKDLQNRLDALEKGGKVG